jgi:hypothetical protein
MDGAVKLERVHVGLKEGRPLLQTVDRQMVSGAQGMLVAALVDPTMGPPGARGVTGTGGAVGRETPLLSDETERGEGREPLKPLRRIRHQLECSVLWTDDHIRASSPIFDQGDHTGTNSQFRRVQASSCGG